MYNAPTCKQTLSIIIPCYNEEKTLCELLTNVCNVKLLHNIEKEIILVNDFSADNSEAVGKAYIENHPNHNIKYTKHTQNQGKGMAIRTGLTLASGDFVIIQDADLENNPEDYNPLLQALLEKEQQVIYGSRFLTAQNKHSYPAFYWGGRLVSWVANILFLQNLTDEPTCYKIFRTDFLKSIPLQCTGFEFCPEITAKIAKRGIKIKEIPIDYFPRSVQDGKKIKWHDGLKAIWTLIRYRFSN